MSGALAVVIADEFRGVFGAEALDKPDIDNFKVFRKYLRPTVNEYALLYIVSYAAYRADYYFKHRTFIGHSNIDKFAPFLFQGNDYWIVINEGDVIYSYS